MLTRMCLTFYPDFVNLNYVALLLLFIPILTAFAAVWW